jgi:hypothetical protein
MDPTVERLQGKSPLLCPHLIVSLSKLMHLLLMPDLVPSKLYLLQEVLNLKHIGNR